MKFGTSGSMQDKLKALTSIQQFDAMHTLRGDFTEFSNLRHPQFLNSNVAMVGQIVDARSATFVGLIPTGLLACMVEKHF